MLLDLAAGQYLVPYLPPIDKYFQRFTQAVVAKLDRPSRTLSALRLRGIFVTVLLVPAAFYTGTFFNYLTASQPYVPLAVLVLLIPVVGQKTTLRKVVKAGRSLSKKSPAGTTDPHVLVRAAGASAALGFALRLVPRSFWWCLGGFALLLPYMLIANFVDTAAKRRSGYAESPFFSSMALLHELSSVLPAALGALLLALAHFFLPGTNLWVLRAFNPAKVFFKGATYGPASRYFPLNVIAVGLNLSMEADIGEKTAGKKISDKAVHWIGPKEGRAQLVPADLKQIWLVTIVALIFYFLIAAMVFLLLLRQGGSG